MRKRIQYIVVAMLLSIITALGILITRIFDVLHSIRLPKEDNKEHNDVTVYILTTFFNSNWCRSHITPIARAKNVKKVVVVADGPTVDMPKVEYVYPNKKMQKIFGRILTKFLMLMFLSIKNRPDVIIGYYLIPNAFLALIVAKIVNCYSIYQNTAGPFEVIGGGYLSDNVILSRLGYPSKLLETLLHITIRKFDAIIVRGQTAVNYIRKNNLSKNCAVIVGSVDDDRFKSTSGHRDYDVVTVARLAEIKQLDHLLQIAAKVKNQNSDFRVAIVGDGPLRDELEAHSRKLGIEKNVEFLGRRDDVPHILANSKIFALTSQSEGLSIALAEAMCCGLPGVVYNVGELKELVIDGQTGWLIPPGDIDTFSEKISDLINSHSRWEKLSAQAYERASKKNGLKNVAIEWQNLLNQLSF